MVEKEQQKCIIHNTGPGESSNFIVMKTIFEVLPRIKISKYHFLFVVTLCSVALIHTKDNKNIVRNKIF